MPHLFIYLFNHRLDHGLHIFFYLFFLPLNSVPWASVHCSTHGGHIFFFLSVFIFDVECPATKMKAIT